MPTGPEDPTTPSARNEGADEVWTTESTDHRTTAPSQAQHPTAPAPTTGPTAEPAPTTEPEQAPAGQFEQAAHSSAGQSASSAQSSATRPEQATSAQPSVSLPDFSAQPTAGRFEPAASAQSSAGQVEGASSAQASDVQSQGPAAQASPDQPQPGAPAQAGSSTSFAVAQSEQSGAGQAGYPQQTGAPHRSEGTATPSPWSAAGHHSGVSEHSGSFGSAPGYDSGRYSIPEQGGAGAQQAWTPQDGGVLHGAAHPSYVGQPVSNPYAPPQQDIPVQRTDSPPRKGAGKAVVGITLLALLVGGAAGATGGYLVAEGKDSGGPTALEVPPPAKQAATPAPAGSVEAVAEKVLPTVVQIQARGRSTGAEGSGFTISADGLILTNNHVVAEAASGGQLTVVFRDGRTAKARIVGRDPSSDLAVIKADGVGGLPVSELGRSDDLRVGQTVVAIGSPFELSGTVTSGIVSSLQRPTRAGGENGDQATVLDAIQTDAAINPGNSGGPLVNAQGQVIGINSAIYSPQGQGSVGIGFAIPIDQARRTADEIVKTGRATQTVLGVQVRDGQNTPGALIAEVVAGGAGEQAGLKQGDVVTKLDDRRIDSSDALVAAIRSKAPGDKVKLVIGDGQRTVEATLGGQPVPVN